MQTLLTTFTNTGSITIIAWCAISAILILCYFVSHDITPLINCIGCAAALILAILGQSYWLQLVVATVIMFTLPQFFYKYRIRKYNRRKTEPLLNELIGRTGRLNAAVPKSEPYVTRYGTIEIDQVLRRATGYRGCEIKECTKVEVVGLKGVDLVVKEKE